MIAIQNYFAQHQNYGVYSAVEIPEGQVKIGNESYDVSVNLLDAQGQRIRRLLIPIKTRETEGGGHSHLFSRDISSAILAVRYDSPEDYLAVIIVAKNWSAREADLLAEKVDHLAVFNLDPGEFSQFSAIEQERLNLFVAQVLSGSLLSKTSSEM